MSMWCVSFFFAGYIYLSLSMHLLPRMNVMLDFILNAASPAQRKTEQVTITKNLVDGRIRTRKTARPPDYKSTAFTARPILQRYERRLG